MLLIDIFRYLKRRADMRPVYLANFVDQSPHHGAGNSAPSVEIIIPTRDKVDLLRACVESIFEKTTYENYRVTIVDNQSVDPATQVYFDDLAIHGVKILTYPHKFNYSAICNMAAEKSDAEYLCFLNNDTEVMSSGWLRSALDHASQRDVGLVGVSLVNRDSTIQSAGLAIGVHGVAGHVTRGIDYREKKSACFEVSAVSFACAFISRHKFLDLGSLDENFPVGLNDVALGIKSAERGFHNVVCAGVNVYHQEYGSRSSMRNLGGAIQASRDVVLFLRSFGLSQDKYATTEMKKIG